MWRVDAPQRFRKRPVVVEAIQWTGTNRDAVAAFLGDVLEFDDADGRDLVAVATLEGVMRAEPGDWLVRGIAGEFYPCDRAIFSQTFDPVDG